MYFERNISEKGSYLSCVTNCEYYFSPKKSKVYNQIFFIGVPMYDIYATFLPICHRLLHLQSTVMHSNYISIPKTRTKFNQNRFKNTKNRFTYLLETFL